MKELELPWTHWYDQSNISDFIASLGSTKIAGSKADPSNVLHDTLFGEPYSPFSKLGRAEDLEPIVRQSVIMWYQSRFTRDFVDPTSKKGLPQITSAVEQWISHILLNRSMNIATSQTSSVQAAVGSDISGIPATMFYNSNALQTVLPNAGNSLKQGFKFQNSSSIYSDGIEKLDLNICYKDPQDGTRFLVAVPKTEGPFPFPIIEPGVEDYQAIQTLVKWAKSMKYPALLPPKAVAAMLMVDFLNHIWIDP
ncbi:hypothetical protein BDZ89DRAFT_1137365 [Hymenopellis radicata]|nr:hypothetical protein BDZ89DRAFT_1137365 [Hymenopellis radicata]